MRKKPITTKPTKARSKTRARVCSPAVVTSKTQDVELKRALLRRAKRQTHTQLVDHAVPESLLFQGVISTHATLAKPSVATGSHTLSPFILSLKASLPTPAELLQEAQYRPLGVNLLTENPNVYVQKTPDLSRDLVLSPSDVIEQVKRGLLPELPRLHVHVPRPVHAALRYDSPIPSAFSSDAFIPHTLPKDIFTYFDFPEEEPAIASAMTGEEVLDQFDLDMAGEETANEPPTQPWWQRISIPTFPPFHLPTFTRALASFIGLSFLFVLPLHAMNVVQDLRDTKGELERSGLEAVSLLSLGAQAALARDVLSAGSNFKSASAQFQETKHTIDDLGAGTNFLLSVLPVTGSSFTSGTALVEAGKELAIAGARMSDGYAAMEQELSPTPISRLNILEAYLSSIVPHLEDAQKSLNEIDLDAVPEEHRATLQTVQSSLPALITTIDAFEHFYGLAQELLGADGTKRYLIVFQNNTEIRPTGGFIGSFAEVKVHNGVIEHLNVPGGGSYDLQGTLQENLRAPEPLQLLSARWEFQDGNWFPDFPTSARQLMQFYEDAGGPSVDGVLAVNATFVSELIGLLGPIEMEEYSRTIDEENFIFETQKIAEYEFDKEVNTPKAFIGDLAPKLVEKMIQKSSEDFLAVVDYLNTGLTRKDLQLYLADQELERQILAQGWGGEMKQTQGDYLMVVDTNLGGGKTDGVIQEHADLHVDVSQDGTITNTLTISRTHFGIQGLLFTGVNNVDYLRVYVPKGSTLLEASGFSIPDQSLFEIPDEEWTIDDDLAYGLLTTTVDPQSGTMVSEEHGKAVFGNWVQTMPGSTSTVTIKYRLPFKLASLNGGRVVASLKSLVGLPQTDTYSLLVQKQSGVLDRTTNIHVTLPEDLNALWASHDPIAAELTNATDELFAILVEAN
ncbi:MAG: DUF4012 domain-containing protein [Candidatus Uhrbacteria bacterium]|nr:DUF4012 domain-containing protein [Candidatus Uhrbacteria bacterium]